MDVTERLEIIDACTRDMAARIARLEHQAGTILYLSAVNLIANALTFLIAFLAVTS